MEERGSGTTLRKGRRDTPDRETDRQTDRLIPNQQATRQTDIQTDGHPWRPAQHRQTRGWTDGRPDIQRNSHLPLDTIWNRGRLGERQLSTVNNPTLQYCQLSGDKTRTQLSSRRVNKVVGAHIGLTG